jgi:hypothetical protein
MNAYTPKQILQFSKSYIEFLAGAEIPPVLRIHAQLAEIDLRYVKFEGLDISDVNKVFSAANAQGKIAEFFRVIEKDGISIRDISLKTNPLSTPTLERISTTGYIPSNIISDLPESTILHGYINNPTTSTIRVFLKVTLTSVSDNVTISIELPPGISSIPRIRPLRFLMSEAKQIDQTIRLFTLNIELFLPGEILIDLFQTDIWVSQPNIVLIASQDAVKFRDFSSILSWWVNSGAEGISDLILESIPEHIRINLGYDTNVSVNSQVENIYMALIKKKLKFLPAELLWIAKSSSILQRVQRPNEILLSKTPAYNCLDGAILMASILEKVGIDPLIVVLPSHALVGWKFARQELLTPRDYMNSCGFLDVTSLTTNANFNVAISSAEGYLIKYQNHFSQETIDIKEFAKIIDVKLSRGFPSSLY